MRGTVLAVLQQRARQDPAGKVSATFQEIAAEIGTTPGVVHEILLALRTDGELELLHTEGSGKDGVFEARIPMRRA
jgi:DNA-binding Lrp family transcriptional regulator